MVAVRQGSIVGFCLGTTISPATGHVPQIAVEPASQRLGLGRALLRSSLRAMERAGCRRVTLSVSERNSLAASWYERAGFRRLTRFAAYVRKGA